MSASAASLPCPICAHIGVFESVQSLRDRLIQVSTNKILCPVCQEEVYGLDKLTIHLFSHVKLMITKGSKEKEKITVSNEKSNSENESTAQQKKPKTSVVKNKTPSSALNAPVKFVKIYPKLPVISVNTVPVLDISRSKECLQGSEPMFVKTEATLVQTNTTCNICGLQFIDANILRMHRCLIHNIDENSNQTFTRYHCHLCPKNFKMRGSLMVHLRVAHFGFLSGSSHSNANIDKATGNIDQQDEKLTHLERNENKQWQCEVCRKCFTTKYFLKKHKRLHTGETPYACAQCNKTFTFQQSYHKHLLYHNDEKPHSCTYCGRAFKELSTLHNHQRIHTGEKPFSCETCGKCFRQRVSYLVHRRIHTGVMPYRCTACQKSFRYKVSQRTHKCQAQPPGTVVRQTGELVEKLKQKHVEPNTNSCDKQNTITENLNYTDVSEANAELVRTGAKLSLEDMESEHFSLIADSFSENGVCNKSPDLGNMYTAMSDKGDDDGMFNQNIDELIDSIPIQDKNMPSPSEILKNLCLSKEDDYIGILQQTVEEKSNDICKDYNIFL